MKQGYVYILTNKPRGTLYVGVTSQLIQRTYIHKEKIIPGFSKRYELDRLVYFEHFDSMENAILREKQLKNWRRQWKINQIEAVNPEWSDLYPGLF